jgi:hypothetical protein
MLPDLKETMLKPRREPTTVTLRNPLKWFDLACRSPLSLDLDQTKDNWSIKLRRAGLQLIEIKDMSSICEVSHLLSPLLP